MMKFHASGIVVGSSHLKNPSLDVIATTTIRPFKFTDITAIH